MKLNQMPLHMAKKIYRKFNTNYTIDELYAQIQQLENRQVYLQAFLEQRTYDIENRHAIQLLKLRTELTKTLNQHADNQHSNYTKATPKPYSDYLRDLEQLDPAIFPVWSECFETGRLAYLDDPDSSCSTGHNFFATVFQTFVANHARGHLLDQGCGIHGLPYYLEDYPLELISAIEPLELVQPVDFEVVRGFSEFLPWADESFATIVNGTSLDHVLCLETALSETYRVLQSDGKFLVWIASIKGAKPFDKHARPVVALDKFHLFHFHESWFEAMMLKQFKIVDKLTFPNASFDHIFYAFKKK